ncbi:hypothetical protein [Kitasatospora indigofera]|uniref:hypothetical protein n=1 Tax=Kitasatospora indigofera TaxID=67307 RepID=UPI0036AB2245
MGTVLDAHPDAEQFGTGSGAVLVTDVTDYQEELITDEVFANVLGVVRLPGSDAASFLRNAVDFVNDTVRGTLGATLIVHPSTERAHREAVNRAVADLRYGTLGVNCWSAIGFLLGFTPWGAYPGHNRQSIGSGTGFVHNAFMLDEVEKTVLRAPFAPAPQGLFKGCPSFCLRPPYLVTSRTALTTMRRLIRFTAAPSLLRLSAIVVSVLRR